MMKYLPEFKKIAFPLSLIGFISLPHLISPKTVNAAILNGSFESNFTSWTTGGVTSIETASFGVTPTNGTKQALGNTGGTTPLETNIVGGLEDFLGVNLGIFDNPSDPFNGVATEGSAIYQDFTANAGDTLTLDWNFLTNDTVTPDYAFIILSPTSNLGTLTYGSLPKLSSSNGLIASTSIFSQQTGYKPFNFVIPTTGTYRLGVGVVDVGDVERDSGVLVDNVVLTPFDSGITTPEPSSVLGLVSIGLLLFGFRSFRP